MFAVLVITWNCRLAVLVKEIALADYYFFHRQICYLL
jgi:hypothetical protein